MRRAPYRITVLQTFAVAGLAGSLAAKVATNPASYLLHSGVRLRRKKRFIKMLGICIQCKGSKCCNAGTQTPQIFGPSIGQACETRHGGGAVHDCQTFLGPQDERRYAGSAKCDLSGHLNTVAPDFPFAAKRCREVGQWRQVATCTNRALRRHDRKQVCTQQRGQCLKQEQTDTRPAFA